eukprot:3104268-Rhodomonas_salina.2
MLRSCCLPCAPAPAAPPSSVLTPHAAPPACVTALPRAEPPHVWLCRRREPVHVGERWPEDGAQRRVSARLRAAHTRASPPASIPPRRAAACSVLARRYECPAFTASLHCCFGCKLVSLMLSGWLTADLE